MIDREFISGDAYVKKRSFKYGIKIMEKGGFTVKFWDGKEKNYGNTSPKFKIIFNREPDFSASDLKEDLDVLMGSAYVDGIVDFEGNLDDIVATAFEKDPVELPYHLASLRQKMIKEEEKRKKAISMPIMILAMTSSTHFWIPPGLTAVPISNMPETAFMKPR